MHGIRYIPTSGGTIRVRVEGDGPQTVIFLPDAPAMLEHHEKLFQARTEHFKFLSIEPLGTGFSIPRADFDFSFSRFADTIVEAIDNTGEQNAIFATGCTNAYFALLIAAQRPDLVKNLLLWQAPSWDQQSQFVLERIDPQGVLQGPQGSDFYSENKYSASEWWFDVSSGPRGDKVDMTRITHSVFDNGGCQCLAELVRSMLFGPIPPFEIISHEATLLWCGSDETHSQSSPESLLELVPNGNIVEWSEAGHLPDAEFPEQVVDLLSNF